MVHQCEQLLSVPECILRVLACFRRKACVWTHKLLLVCVGECMGLYKCEFCCVHVCPLECLYVCARV